MNKCTIREVTLIRGYGESEAEFILSNLQRFQNRGAFRGFLLRSLTESSYTGVLPYRVSLEGLDRSVLTQLTHMDAHVCAAGGKRVVALPVDIQSRCCWEAETESLGLLQQ